jgi:phage terminase small subunit
VTRNGSESARRAGYSTKTAYQIAFENLRKPEVVAALEAKEAALARKLEIDREAVIGGILQAIAEARSQGNAGTMVSGWSQIAKITGLDKPEPSRAATLSPDADAVKARLEAMPTEQLLEIVAKAAKGT